MTRTLLGLLAAGAVLASIPALAQQKAPAAPAAAAAKPAVVIPFNVFVKGQVPGQYLSKDRLIGAKVQNKDGAIIGDIEDLIVGPGNQIQGVVMGTGGFLGAGEKKIGVRLGALQFATKDGKTVISLPQATKEVLGALEPFQRAEPKKGVIEKAKEKGKELIDKTKETSKDAATAVKDKAAPVIDKAKEAVKPADAKK